GPAAGPERRVLSGGSRPRRRLVGRACCRFHLRARRASQCSPARREDGPARGWGSGPGLRLGHGRDRRGLPLLAQPGRSGPDLGGSLRPDDGAGEPAIPPLRDPPPPLPPPPPAPPPLPPAPP